MKKKMKDDEKTRAQLIEELQECESKYRLLAENISDVIWTTDLEGSITFITPSSENLYGYSSEEMLGMPLEETLSPQSVPIVKKMIGDALADYKGAVLITIDTRHKNGQMVPVEIIADFLWDENGIPTGITGVSRDISKRKLLEKQLIEAQKMESVGRLAGGVAHDFNNLLTVILSCAEVVAAGMREDDPIMEDIRDIRKAGKRAASLTRQLLAFSRRQMIQPQIMDLNELIADLERMLRRLIGADIDMPFTPTPGLWKVEADPGQIEQIIVNITINARDAMPDGGRLTIETANVELDEEYVDYRSMVTPGEYVMIAITDTGCGMDAETMKNVFEPFFTTKETGKGTGLGLSVAYGIVKQHKGNIWVYSEPEKGTVFKIYLPRCLKKSGQEYRSRAPIKIAELRGSETVLAVDDDDTILRAVVRMLKQHGYNMLQAANGEEAKVVADEYEGPIHLLLTDVVMPGMSGRETAESVLVGRSEMNLLFMSGYTGNAIAHHGVLDPEVNFISKPFSSDDLARKVRMVLDESRENR